MRCLNKKKFVDTSVSMGHLTDLHSLFLDSSLYPDLNSALKKKKRKKKNIGNSDELIRRATEVKLIIWFAF